MSLFTNFNLLPHFLPLAFLCSDFDSYFGPLWSTFTLKPPLKPPILLFGLHIRSLAHSSHPFTPLNTQIHTHTEAWSPSPLLSSRLRGCRPSRPQGKPEGAISRGEETGSIILHTYTWKHGYTHLKTHRSWHKAQNLTKTHTCARTSSDSCQSK